MKKILLYTDTPQVGGAELQIFLLAKFLDKTNFQPILCCSNFPELDEWCEKFTREGIEVKRIKVSGKHDPRHLIEVKKIIKESEIDIIHAHIWNPASCRYAFSAAKNSKKPLIITEHDPFKLSSIKDLFKKSALKNVSKIVAVSNNNLKTLQNLYPEQKQKMCVIHNGIDSTWWQSQLLGHNSKDRTEVREKIFHAREDTLVISCIAELHERKGIKYAILALKTVVEKYQNIKLVIIGAGKEENNLRRLVKKEKLEKQVTFTGRQSRIPRLLSSSEIFILPSKREAFGLVNLEAMICSLPVIASNVGGIPEIINSRTGILVEAQNPLEISTALLKLIESEELRKQLGEEGKKRVLAEFSADVVARKYEEIYNNY